MFNGLISLCNPCFFLFMQIITLIGHFLFLNALIEIDRNWKNKVIHFYDFIVTISWRSLWALQVDIQPCNDMNRQVEKTIKRSWNGHSSVCKKKHQLYRFLLNNRWTIRSLREFKMRYGWFFFFETWTWFWKGFRPFIIMFSMNVSDRPTTLTVL